MSDDRDNLIRSRAYALWEAEGAPNGRHDDHWAQASREIEEAQEEAGVEPFATDVPAASLDNSTSAADVAAKPVGSAKRARKASADVAAAAAPKGRRKKDG